MEECVQCGKVPSPGNVDCVECLRTLTVGGPAPRHEVPEVSPGTVIDGKWRIERPLGEGGMGAVFVARDLELDRDVALKLLSRALVGDDASQRRFEREARLTASLDHPNIVPIYAVGAFEGRPFLVMKLVLGRPLQTLLAERRGPWDWPSARAVLAPLLDGLGFVHARGLVHRDVKPNNVVVDATGHVTLLDFGLVKVAEEGLTTPGQMVGTWRFMAPEQMFGDRVVDARADLYAVGLIAHRLLCGALPFKGDAATVARAKLEERLRPARELNPRVSPPVEAVLQRVLRATPTERHDNAAAFLEDLDHAFGTPAMAPRRPRLLWAAGALGSVAAAAVLTAWATARPGTASVSTPPAPTVVSARAGAPDEQPRPPDDEVPTAPVRQPGTNGPASPGVAPVQVAPPTPTAQAAPRPTAPRRATSEARGRIIVITRAAGSSAFADVEVDGVPHGETPAQLELSPGRHTVRVSRSGFVASTRVVTVRSGRTEKLVIELTP